MSVPHRKTQVNAPRNKYSRGSRLSCSHYATVEDEIDNEYVPAPNIRRVLQSPTPEASVAANRFLKYLKKAAAAISTIGGAQGFQHWVEDNLDEAEIEEIHESYTTISSLVRPKIAPAQVVTSNLPSGVNRTDETLESLGSCYIFRSASYVKILGPIETFKAAKGKSLSGKTLAFMEMTGREGVTMMCALSGYSKCVRDHDRILDSRLWTDEIMRFSDFYDHPVKNDGFDVTHNEAKGTGFASHAEKQLILWSACQLVAKHLGPKPSIRQHIAHLHHLRFIETPVIEISVSADYACDHCHKFKDLISALTGIKYVIKLPPTVAEIPRVRNEQGKRLHSVVEVETPRRPRYRQEPVHLAPAPTEMVEPQMNLCPVARPKTPKLTKSREKAVNLLAEVARGQFDVGKFAYVKSAAHSSAKKRKYHLDSRDAD